MSIFCYKSNVAKKSLPGPIKSYTVKDKQNDPVVRRYLGSDRQTNKQPHTFYIRIFFI